MTTSPESRALTPLWSFFAGSCVGAAWPLLLQAAPASGLASFLVVAGIVSLALALRTPRRAALLWFVAGVAIVGGHATARRTDQLVLATLIEAEDPVWVRAELAPSEGWKRGRWGWRSRVEVRKVDHPRLDIPPLRRARLEIRGGPDPLALPPPGAVVRGLVSIRGSPDSVLLTTSSASLLKPTGEVALVPRLRDSLVKCVLDAAGTDVRRIRAAELAATLSLGRGDLIPSDRRDGWRRSGLAHVLAVSGLHVGLVGGALWLSFAAAGASPTTTRTVLLLALPGYAVLAGASPSAVRAALMACTYLAARQLGRAIIPLAAVLLTASAMLVADPTLITRVSFQLTVAVTAALVRWGPRLIGRLPLPRWMAAMVAVPLIAQLAASPIVAAHFAVANPGAAPANFFIPWLLGPVVIASVGTAVIAPLSATVAAALLDIVAIGERLLWLAGSPGRAAELIPPPLPWWLLAPLAGLALSALLPWRRAGKAAAGYVLCLIGLSIWWFAAPPSNRAGVELLPVAYGLSVHVTSGHHSILMDGGGRRREAAELLAGKRVRRLEAVVASHADEDHVAGLTTVLNTTAVASLVVPEWLCRSPEAVPLLRAARRRGTRIRPVVRGNRLTLETGIIDILWPPHSAPASSDNERSLVARMTLQDGAVLLTADIGRETERRLIRTTHLRSAILVVPHHGSRGSCSAGFLDAVSPDLALIPAGPENAHNHPHPEVVSRIRRRGIAFRSPILHGRCGVWLTPTGLVINPPNSSNDRSPTH